MATKSKDNAATELYELYNSYMKAGFTAEQAWKLIEIYFLYHVKN